MYRSSQLSWKSTASGKLPLANVMANVIILNKLPRNTRVFTTAEKLEVRELVANFLLKTGTCEAKNS